MVDHNGEEYDAVIKLYRDGKITEAQKNALIEALDGSDKAQSRDGEDRKAATELVFSVSGMNDPYDAGKVKRILERADGAERANVDVKAARATVCGEVDPSALIKALAEAGYHARPVDIKLGDCKNTADVDVGDGSATAAHDGGEGEKGNGDGLGAMMSKLGRKVKEAVQKGVQAAALAEKQVEQAINNAFSGAFTSADGEECVKHKPKRYDGVDYDDMSICIKYTSGGKSLKWADKTRNSSKLLTECEKLMDGAMYDRLRKLIDERFVGVHTCDSGSRTLKVIVEPDEY